MFNTNTLDSNAATCCILVNPQYKTSVYCVNLLPAEFTATMLRMNAPKYFLKINYRITMFEIITIDAVQFKGIVLPRTDPEFRILCQD